MAARSKEQASRASLFLRNILEEGQAKRLAPLPWGSHWDTSMGISCEGNWGLFYFGDHCPAYKMMTMLPENTTWKVDIIDTRAMTITPVAGLFNTVTSWIYRLSHGLLYA